MTMESSDTNAVLSFRALYKSKILACLLSCIAISAILLPSFPSGDKDAQNDSHLIWTFILSAGAMLLLTFIGLRFILRRSHFHQRQEIFWPLRCSHCARAVHILKECPADENSLDVDDASLSISTHQNLQRFYSAPHKSLLKIFCMLEVVFLINLLYIMIGDIVCLHGGTDIVLVSQCLHVFITILVHIVSVVLLFLYYDSVFTQRPKFCYSFAIAVASFIWMSSIKISNPINELNNSNFYQLNTHCKMNVTFGSFITNDEIINSFMAECGIVGAAIVWQIWSNMLPLTVLQLEGRQHALIVFQSYDGIQGKAYSRKVLTFLKRFLNRKTFFRGGKSSEEQSLLGCDPFNKMKRQLMKYYVIIFIISVSYSTVRFLVYSGASSVSENTKKYITWVCRMALNTPLLALLSLQARFTTKPNGFKLKRGVSILGELRSHDMILLLGCCGIFMLNILRFVGAVEIVFRAAGHADHKGDHLVLASFGIVYTSFELFSVWVMTSFFIIVQRQAITGVKEAKWTLLCLMYTLIFSATQWIGIFEGTHSFNLLCHAFGKSTGENDRIGTSSIGLAVPFAFSHDRI